MAKEQEDVTRGQEDVAWEQEQVELEEQMEVEEQVEKVGAVKHRDMGVPRASPPVWGPKPLPVGCKERLLVEPDLRLFGFTLLGEQLLARVCRLSRLLEQRSSFNFLSFLL